VLLWAAFLGYDYLEVRVLGSADFATMVVYRFCTMPIVLCAVAAFHREPPLSESAFSMWTHVAMMSFSVSSALLCLETGGLGSLYAIGSMLSSIGLVLAPRPFAKAIVEVLFVVSPYPIIVGAATFVRPDLRAQVHEPTWQAHILQHAFGALVLVPAIAAASHAYFNIRRELVEAQNIGRYRLVRLLGRGGMSEVWEAEHRTLHQIVALKVLESPAESEEVSRMRFEREVRATTSLTHPHTIRVLDYGITDEGLLFYAMEWLDGENLNVFVKRRGPLPVARALHLARAASHALGEAHALGIVHRDVKAENLVVARLGGEPDFVKVLDFGIAHIFDRPDTVALTGTGQIIGTPTTISPEVVLGDEATAASDVYAMGVVLYFMVTGRMPFAGEAAKMLVAHVHEAPMPPSAYAPDLPEPVEALILRCLAKAPADRPRNGRELAAHLDPLAARFPWDAIMEAPVADADALSRTPAESHMVAESSSTTEQPTRVSGDRRPA